MGKPPRLLVLRAHIFHQERHKKYFHQENMSVKCIPLIPYFYIVNTGVSRGKPNLLTFAPKQIVGTR